MRQLSQAHKRLLMLSLVSFIIGISLYLQIQRISYRTLPGGDESSWMSVASELIKGNGFFTRSLEFHWLEQYTLPRPEDFRFPAFTLTLAGAFKIFGVSYLVALLTVVFLNLSFEILFFITIRKIFGNATALFGLVVTVFSPIQLMYNTFVLTESLFGLILCGLVFWSTYNHKKIPVKWIGLGLLTGILYLVRPNGILFLPGIFIYFILSRKEKNIPLKYLLYSLLAFFLTILPWLVRNYVYFEDPFHIAGNAGLLKAQSADQANLTLTQFISQFGLFFPFVKIFSGIKTFFHVLGLYEHWMHVIPFLFVIVGVVRKKIFYNPFITTGFLLTVSACFYVIFTSWAGIRYFSPFLPFVYAYGIHQGLSFLTPWFINKPQYFRYIVYSIICCLILSPVYYPHRFYQRKYGNFIENFQNQIQLSNTIRGDINYLNRLVPQGSTFIAHNTFCDLNYLTLRNCVCIKDRQGLDSSMVHRMVETFNPQYAILTVEELKLTSNQKTLENMAKNARFLDLVHSSSLANFYRIKSHRNDKINPPEVTE